MLIFFLIYSILHRGNMLLGELYTLGTIVSIPNICNMNFFLKRSKNLDNKNSISFPTSKKHTPTWRPKVPCHSVRSVCSQLPAHAKPRPQQHRMTHSPHSTQHCLIHTALGNWMFTINHAECCSTEILQLRIVSNLCIWAFLPSRSLLRI